MVNLVASVSYKSSDDSEILIQKMVYVGIWYI
jgi:hypothetical protein